MGECETFFSFMLGNVVPPEMSAVIDCRIANDVDLDAFEQMVNYKLSRINAIYPELHLNYHTK